MTSVIGRAVTLSTIVLLLGTSVALGATRSTPKPVVVMGACKPGLHAAPEGPFAVFLGCEDALGSYLTVVYSGLMGVADGAWRIDGERFWYEATWGEDVTSYAWDSRGQGLYVATSGIYGTGGVHALDLRGRRSRRLLGAEDGSETLFTITKLDEKAKRLEVVREEDGRRTPMFVSLATDSLARSKP